MASLNEIRKLTPRKLAAMVPKDLDILMMDSLKEVGGQIKDSDTRMIKIEKSMDKLKSIDAKLNRLDFIEELVKDMKKMKGDVTEMEKKIETNRSEITTVKEGETRMKNEIEDLKLDLPSQKMQEHKLQY